MRKTGHTGLKMHAGTNAHGPHTNYNSLSWPIDLYRIVEEKKRWGHQGTSIENSELYFFVHYVTKQIACRILKIGALHKGRHLQGGGEGVTSLVYGPIPSL